MEVQRFFVLRSELSGLKKLELLFRLEAGSLYLSMKGRLDETHRSASTVDRKPLPAVVPAHKALNTTTATRTTPKTFAELSLNWMEFYHKSDNISVRILDITLYASGSWGQSPCWTPNIRERCLYPKTLCESAIGTPYLGQFNHDGADYDGMPIGLANFVTAKQEVVASFSALGTQITYQELDYNLVFQVSNTPKICLVTSNSMWSENLLALKNGGAWDAFDAQSVTCSYDGSEDRDAWIKENPMTVDSNGKSEWKDVRWWLHEVSDGNGGTKKVWEPGFILVQLIRYEYQFDIHTIRREAPANGTGTHENIVVKTDTYSQFVDGKWRIDAGTVQAREYNDPNCGWAEYTADGGADYADRPGFRENSDVTGTPKPPAGTFPNEIGKLKKKIKTSGLIKGTDKKQPGNEFTKLSAIRRIKHFRLYTIPRGKRQEDGSWANSSTDIKKATSMQEWAVTFHFTVPGGYSGTTSTQPTSAPPKTSDTPTFPYNKENNFKPFKSKSINTGSYWNNKNNQPSEGSSSWTKS